MRYWLILGLMVAAWIAEVGMSVWFETRIAKIRKGKAQ